MAAGLECLHDDAFSLKTIQTFVLITTSIFSMPAGLECLDGGGVQRLAGELGRLKAEKAQFASRLNEFVTGTQALEKEWATVNTEALYVSLRDRHSLIRFKGTEVSESL